MRSVLVKRNPEIFYGKVKSKIIPQLLDMGKRYGKIIA